jgi:hypothetical protein
MIEVDHIVQPEDGGTNDIHNAMPLCFECHGLLHHYNRLHPRGTKYFERERKTRRDQIYEEFTRHLVPAVDYQVTQSHIRPGAPPRTFPDVSFILRHLGDHLPVRVLTVLTVKVGAKTLKPLAGHYAGKKPWRLNPRTSHEGHFYIPPTAVNSRARLEVQAAVTIIDMYDRHHRLLPVSWIYVRKPSGGKPGYWYFEP